LRRRFVFTTVLALSLCFAVPGSAAIIIASGAGPLPGSAENLTAASPTEIVGTLNGVNQNDVSMFEIAIMEPFFFSAMTVDPGSFGIPDTVLSLFDSLGHGVYLNDDISGSSFFSCLPSGAANPCPTGRAGTGPLLAGTYFLAISRSANYPLDALNNEIFSTVFSTDVVGPNSGVGPIKQWDGNAFAGADTDLVKFDIVLTGTVPEPATWMLTAAAGLAFALLRRKRARS
jgi:hypothetical protein